jgi:hypothetical protein
MTHPLGWTLGMSAFTPSAERGDERNGFRRQRPEDPRPRPELRRIRSQVRRPPKRATEAPAWRGFISPFGVVKLSPDWLRELEKRAPDPPEA